MEWRHAVVEPQDGVAHTDLVAVTQHVRARHALAIDERAVHAAEVAQHHRMPVTLEHAVLKNKSGASLHVAQDRVRGPWGLR